MSKIAREVAEQEFEKWLDFKKVKSTKRLESKDQGEQIISAIENGSIIIDEKNNLVLTLDFPVEDSSGNVTLSTLKFSPRLRVVDLNKRLKGFKADDVDGRVLAYAAALTGENTGIIGCLDTEDYRIVGNIVMYFL